MTKKTETSSSKAAPAVGVTTPKVKETPATQAARSLKNTPTLSVPVAAQAAAVLAKAAKSPKASAVAKVAVKPAQVTTAKASASKPVKDVAAKTKADKAATKKVKLIRDSFTLPETDYSLFATLKQRALAGGIEIKKSEILRAGLQYLQSLDDAILISVLSGIERMKTGRPAKK